MVIPDGIPKLMDMPMNAIPSVPHVVQDDPVTVDIAAQIRSTRGRKRSGSISFSPYATRNGTAPHCTHDAMSAPMESNNGHGASNAAETIAFRISLAGFFTAMTA